MSKKISNIFHKSAGIASNVISAPSRIKHKVKGDIASSKAKVIKEARKYDKAPSYKKGGLTEAGKMRQASGDIIRKEKQKVAKKRKKMM